MQPGQLAVLERVARIEQLFRSRICDGLLESTVLKERREWLSCLDLGHYVLADWRERLEDLLAEAPDDSGAALHKWHERLQRNQLAGLRDRCFTNRSRRVYHLALCDQWDTTHELIAQCIDACYALRASVKKQEIPKS